MFLNEPSAVSGQYGTVAKRVGSKIFKEKDKHIIYYVSALALYCQTANWGRRFLRIKIGVNSYPKAQSDM